MTKAKIAIIVASGKGQRMQTEIPKQFIEIQGKPILMHTLEVFHLYDNSIQLILVLSLDKIKFWEELCEKNLFKIPHQIVVGGKNRFDSVKKGLGFIPNNVLVAVHDGVRPFVSKETIARCFDEADNHGSAIPVIDLVDSIRLITQTGSRNIDRSFYKLVQTPQIFYSEIIKKAYEQEFTPRFTDDASVVEALGIKIHLVEGNRENLKITTSYDLELANFMLNQLK